MSEIDDKVIPETKRIKRLEVTALIAIAGLIFSGGIAYSQLANAQSDIRDLKIAHDNDLKTISRMQVTIAQIDTNVKILVRDEDIARK